MRDKICGDVVGRDESGFCECGGFAQFASVGCDHTPFTCDVMCLKFAVVTNKTAVFKGQSLAPAEAQAMLAYVLPDGVTDTSAVAQLGQVAQWKIDDSVQRLNASGERAVQSVDAWVRATVGGSNASDGWEGPLLGSNPLDELRRKYGGAPWEGIEQAGAELVSAGRAMQATVNETMPFETTSS